MFIIHEVVKQSLMILWQFVFAVDCGEFVFSEQSVLIVSNPSNFGAQTHLMRCHPAEAERMAVQEKEKRKAQSEIAGSSTTVTSSAQKPLRDQNVLTYMRNRIVKYTADSKEHTDRITGVANMLINTGN